MTMTDLTMDFLAENFPGLFDPFGSVRTAREVNRTDIEFIHDKQPWLVEDLSGGSGSAAHQSAGRDVLLSVGGATTNDLGYISAKAFTPYTPGAGQVIEITGVMDKTGIGGGTAQVFLRSNVTGSVVTTTHDITDWQAYGSKETYGLDFTKSHIFAIDFQSLKVGTIHFGLVRQGVLQRIYTIHNDNIRASGYWQYASLPIYWKIYNTATETITEFGYGDSNNGVGFRYKYSRADDSATAVAICATVKSSNGETLENLPGFSLSASNSVTSKTVSTTLVPVLSIRVAATINSIANIGLYFPQAFQIQTDNPIHYRLVYRPTLTGPSWTATSATYSGMEYDVTASAISGGIVVDQGYISSGNNRVSDARSVLDRVVMALGQNSSPDILSIAAVRTGASDASVYSSLRWKELR